MNIGLDLDGVLFDSEAGLIASATLYNYEINKNLIDPNSLIAEERYDWSAEEVQEYLDRYLIKTEETSPLMSCAKEVVEKLRKNGHKIYIITSRGHVSNDEIKATKKALKREKLKFDGIYFSEYDKTNRCKELKIDIMIDDFYNNVINLAKSGIKCLYYHNLVNKPIKHKNVIEVKNWGDIYIKINEILNKKRVKNERNNKNI